MGDQLAAGQALWREATAELKLQMTKATYNTWLAGAAVDSYNGRDLVVVVRNRAAQEWLESRLLGTIQRTVAAVADRAVDVAFVVAGQGEMGEAAETGNEVAEIQAVQFPGFEPVRTNFTQTPKQFYEVVVPAGPPVVTAFVAAVIDHTVGHIVNWHTGERREWWRASQTDISRAAGISVGSVQKAVKMALRRGYVVRRGGDKTRRISWEYRLRRIGEPPQKDTG